MGKRRSGQEGGLAANKVQLGYWKGHGNPRLGSYSLVEVHTHGQESGSPMLCLPGLCLISDAAVQTRDMCLDAARHLRRLKE